MLALIEIHPKTGYCHVASTWNLDVGQDQDGDSLR